MDQISSRRRPRKPKSTRKLDYAYDLPLGYEHAADVVLNVQARRRLLNRDPVLLAEQCDAVWRERVSELFNESEGRLRMRLPVDEPGKGTVSARELERLVAWTYFDLDLESDTGEGEGESLGEIGDGDNVEGREVVGMDNGGGEGEAQAQAGDNVVGEDEDEETTVLVLRSRRRVLGTKNVDASSKRAMETK